MKSPDDMVKELFELSLEAQKKTDAYVSFDMTNNGPLACSVLIMDNGFESGKRSDGLYLVVPDDGMVSDHEKAVDHLKRLIRESDKAKRDVEMDDV